MPTILCATRDADLSDILSYALSRTGCVVRTGRTWPEALTALGKNEITLALLDETLPDGDHDTLHATLRIFGATTGTIVLAASNSEADAVACFEAGADDYVARPYSVPVLIQRVHAITRRRSIAQAPDVIGDRDRDVYRIDQVAFDPAHREVRVGDHAVQLTGTQSALLALLCRHPGHPLPTAMLTTQLQRSDTDDLSSFLALKTHMHLLRAKLAELPGQPLLVRTCRGQGYALYRAAG